MQAQDVETTTQHTDLSQSQVPDDRVPGEPRYQSSDLLYDVGQGILVGGVEVVSIAWEATEDTINDFALVRAIWGAFARRTQKKPMRAQLAEGREKLNAVADILGDTNLQEKLQREGVFELLRNTYKRLFRLGFMLETQLEQEKFYNVRAKYTLYKSTCKWVKDARIHEKDRKSTWVTVGFTLHEGEIPMETPPLTPQRVALTSPSDLTLAASPAVIGGESAGLTSGTSVELVMFGRRREAKVAGDLSSDSDSDESDSVFDSELGSPEGVNKKTGPRIDKGKGRAIDE